MLSSVKYDTMSLRVLMTHIFFFQGTKGSPISSDVCQALSDEIPPAGGWNTLCRGICVKLRTKIAMGNRLDNGNENENRSEEKENDNKNGNAKEIRNGSENKD